MSFGLAGGALATAGFLEFAFEIFLFPIAGLAVSFLIRRGTKSAGQRIAAATLATVGFGLTGVMVFFSIISLQAKIEPFLGAFAWGLGFGIGGAISGQSLSRLWLPASTGSDRIPFAGVVAGLAFTLSGAVAGFLGFHGFSTWNLSSLVLCIWLAHLLGGLLCDAGWHLSLKRSGTIGSWARQGSGTGPSVGK